MIKFHIILVGEYIKLVEAELVLYTISHRAKMAMYHVRIQMPELQERERDPNWILIRIVRMEMNINK